MKHFNMNLVNGEETGWVGQIDRTEKKIVMAIY
jgi:hypothetical protein